MDPKGRRFSLGRVLADTGGILRTRWLGLIMLTLLFGVAGPLALSPLADAMGITGRRFAVSGPPEARFALWILRLAVDAAWAATLIAVALGPRDEPGGGLAPYRRALVCLPAMMLIHVALGLPGILGNLALEGYNFAQADGTNRVSLATMSLVAMGGALASMIVATFLGMAPAVVAHEGLSPGAALSRALRLSRRRRWLLFGLTFGIALLAGLAYLAMTMIATGRDDPAVMEWMGAYGGLVMTPVQTLTLLFWAAVFLELRRLVDPPARETAGIFD